jgi:hypothetical protein
MVSAQSVKGTHKAPRQIKPKPALESGIDGISSANSKLARALGSVDYRTREKGVQALTRFLQRKEAMPDRDMAKIWKGLFFAFWHSDKQPVQVRGAARKRRRCPRRPCMAAPVTSVRALFPNTTGRTGTEAG